MRRNINDDLCLTDKAKIKEYHFIRKTFLLSGYTSEGSCRRQEKNRKSLGRGGRKLPVLSFPDSPCSSSPSFSSFSFSSSAHPHPSGNANCPTLPLHLLTTFLLFLLLLLRGALLPLPYGSNPCPPPLGRRMPPLLVEMRGCI